MVLSLVTHVCVFPPAVVVLIFITMIVLPVLKVFGVTAAVQSRASRSNEIGVQALSRAGQQRYLLKT